MVLVQHLLLPSCIVLMPYVPYKHFVMHKLDLCCIFLCRIIIVSDGASSYMIGDPSVLTCPTNLPLSAHTINTHYKYTIQIHPIIHHNLLIFPINLHYLPHTLPHDYQWRVVNASDRFGFHREFIDDLLPLPGFDYYNYTIFQQVITRTLLQTGRPVSL